MFDTGVPYAQCSVSDELTWSALYAGAGYRDIRELSRTSLRYASMLMEERMLLMGRGTQAGFSGALAAPTGVTWTARAAAAGEAPLTGGTTNIPGTVTRHAGCFGGAVATAAGPVGPARGPSCVDTRT